MSDEKIKVDWLHLKEWREKNIPEHVLNEPHLKAYMRTAYLLDVGTYIMVLITIAILLMNR